VNESRLVAYAVGDRTEEGIEVVVHLLLVLGNTRTFEPGITNPGDRLSRYDSFVGPGFTYGDFHA
jgi:hypothetical protein